ncbi:MAG TPA: DegT/DnrJ/EryC1/StrS family aminotransferase [Candidatus Omnitrophota bacterium]|nr:DegT/DnrJ/EryC1/StrS family aminotransferase [Candidatus Omnitrophota bacterium]HPS20360.1 DegT/DnrJ/EryC1/StrS family aminotransferase [Candidatus Omnitrophota bacterium]
MMRTREKFLVFGKPVIEKPEMREVMDCLASGWLGTGPRVDKFERMFAGYKGMKYAVALNSCTAALHLSLLAIGIKPGDEVIVPAMTFAATANAVVHAGGVPVFADCDRRTLNIDPTEIEKKITRRTQAVIIVHFAGRPCDMDAILSIARKHRLRIIEDCAHAIEAEYHGRKTGTFGDIGCFSFYVTKNITTGEGGMAITKNKKYADKIKVLGMHGMSRDAWKRFGDKGYKHYEIVDAGFKYNMTDMQAAIGIHQLKRIEKSWERRKKLWNIYNKEFEGLPVFLPAEVGPKTRHAYHLYTLLLDIDKVKMSRDRFIDELYRKNIGSGVHYDALHLQPYYRNRFGYRRGDFPNAEWISARTMSLPLSAGLKEDDAKKVINTVKGSLKSRGL